MELQHITPFVPCTKLDDGVGFYCDVLGFELGFRADNYAFVFRDDVALRLIEVEEDVDLSHPMRQQEFYIDVQDIDAIYGDLAKRLRDLPEGRVRPPFDQHYGQREFHVIDPDGTLIYFGEAKKPGTTTTVL